MEIQELMNKIRLPEEAQETVVRFFLEEEMYNEKKGNDKYEKYKILTAV